MDIELLKEKKYEIRNAIAEAIPLGYNHHKTNQSWPGYEQYDKTDWCNWFFHAEEGLKQLGTLGGGNHFIEVGIDEENTPWIVIHSGSRGVGNKMAKYYMAKVRPDNKPKDGVYGVPFDSQEGQDYYTDMNFMLKFALRNRVCMIHKIIDVLRTFDPKVTMGAEFINRTHNHAEKKGDHIIHRKGATHAEKDMLGVVPGHMTRGSYIVKGKGCAASLCSSSHGAGRVKGRKAAERELDLEEMKKQIADSGVAATARHKKDLQEAPGAYKSPADVMSLQEDLVEILHLVKPIVNVKG